MKAPMWGKVVGGVAGLATGQPLVGLVGILLGHQFDRGFAERFAHTESETAGGRRTTLPEAYLKVLFQTIGHLAKADGRVSEDEIRATRAVMHRLNLGPAQIRRAIEHFDAGKAPSFPLVETVRDLRRTVAKSADDRRTFVRFLTEVCVSKPILHERERHRLWAVCKELDVGRVEMAQLEAMLRAQQAFKSSSAGAADAARVAHAYTVLGVSQSNSNADIKTAYRRLMNKHHPDKLAGKAVGADEVAAAESRTRDIRAAYETLKSRRLIR